MTKINKQEVKQVWTTPKLKVYGTVEQLTQQPIPPKVFGSHDGAFWTGQPVEWKRGS